ncbi:ferredoxin reductase family protein [Maritalea mobilis]|uniref:ferredoxin reductase family protein n=1 Tax=Maritalea mobilis TaxID=483324 RepID=UPI0027E0BCB5|nr:ferredoxin reductase family protein [Maritalea mobilis]
MAALYPVACLAPLLFAAKRDVVPTSGWAIAAAGIGLVGLASIAAQFVTSGRFELVSGRLGIDRVMAFHKMAALWVTLTLLLHPVIYVVPTFLADPALGAERLVAYHTLPHYRSGVVALWALVFMVVGSALREHLPLRYEAWRAAHLVLAVVTIGAGLHHAVSVGRFSAAGGLNGYWWAVGAAAVGVVAILYGLRWAGLNLRPWRLVSVTKLADQMWELNVQPAKGTPPLFYHAGQFVWMTEGVRRFPLFDHPFSIADSPLRPGLSFVVKEAGDFTNQIGTLAIGTPIGIDGPYGSFTLEDHDGDAILLIAGGVGIAPILGILRDLVARDDRRPVRLAYAAGHPENFAGKNEIEVARSTLDLETLFLSEEDTPGWDGETGRLDADRLSEMLRGLDPARTVALICGPGPMVTAVADNLIDLGLPSDRVMYERFDYSEGTSRLDRRLKGRLTGLGLALLAGIAAFVALMT